MGFIGGAIRSFSGNPSYSTLDNVKSVPIQGAIDKSLTAYNNLIPTGNSNLASYLSQYTAYNPQAAANTAQEQNAIGGYYNGTVASALGALAAQRQKAVLDAASLAQQNALKSSNLSLLGGQGSGSSSYNTRLLAGNMAQIGAAAALDNANQQQQNYQQVLSGQIGLAGQRTNLANALAMRQMQPYTATASMLGQNQGLLNNILSMNNANNIYGVQQDINPWASFADAADTGIMNAASIAGSVMGMAGGGVGGGKGGGTSQVSSLNTVPGASWSQGGGSTFDPYSPFPGVSMTNPTMPLNYYTPSIYTGDGPSTMSPVGSWGYSTPVTTTPDVGWGGGMGGGEYS